MNNLQAPPWQRLETCAKQTPSQQVSIDWLAKEGVKCWVHRADTLLPAVSGNKLYKLFGNLWAAKRDGLSILSMGGAWSNHLYALAQACHFLEIPVTALVREWGSGESSKMTPTLQDCKNAGMGLLSVNRGEYRELRNLDAESVLNRYGESKAVSWVPEGGSNIAGLLGCYYWGRGLAEQIIHNQIELLWLPCGTGATFAGILCGLSTALAESGESLIELPKVVGVAALKTLQRGENFLLRDIQQYIRMLEGIVPAFHSDFIIDWQLIADCYDKGFGQASPALLTFMKASEEQLRFELEPVYTAKLLFALSRGVAQNELSGKRVCVIHTGGQQGRRGWSELQQSVEEITTEKRLQFVSLFSRGCDDVNTMTMTMSNGC